MIEPDGRAPDCPAENRAQLARERRIRARQLRVQRNRMRARLLLAAVTAIAVVALGSTLASSLRGPDEPASGAAAQESVPLDMTLSIADRTEPTPFFANYRSLHLYLPVAPTDLTEIGFHQASGDHALNMDSLLPDADMTQAEANRGTGRAVQEADSTGPGVLSGSVLRMWRSNRSGPPDTAVDVGGAPGTTVYAPVSGEVIGVRPYSLYGECEDFEVHIQPSGWPEVDVVMIHITDVMVNTGDTVVGGVTPIARIRLLSDRITHQISAYTSDGGDHVHIQLNRLDVPGKLPEIEGS